MSKVLLGFIVLAGIMGFWGVSSYNKLVSLDQSVQAQWSQVENVYQRRADLVPNLVETVKGAAKFEKDTFTAVTEARAKVGQVQGNTSPNDAASVEKFRAAQDQLSSALSKLMVVVERYPDLKATQAFNSTRNTFPTNVIASAFGGRFAEKAYFKAQAGAETAPRVQF